jgi:hypothetical protein
VLLRRESLGVGGDPHPLAPALRLGALGLCEEAVEEAVAVPRDGPLDPADIHHVVA